MRLIAKARNEEHFSSLLVKIKNWGLRVVKENKKWSFIAFDVPKTRPDIILELLEQNAVLERDIRRDLD